MKEINKYVSVIVPVYNEEKHIISCIESLLKQDYPRDLMEWIFVDGKSTDNTKKIVNDYIEKYPNLIFLYENNRKIAPVAMNIGIRKSKGDFIIRLDAHSKYEYNYISKCIYYLINIDADNVGGLAITESTNFIGSCFSRVLSSKFGVGNSQFRTGGDSGYVDTVPFGAFKRDVFKKYGGYDERLIRNQDYELNFRIRKNNGKVYLASDIHLHYFCRDTIKGIINNAYDNGKWNVITMYLCPGSMGIRHFVPLVFVMSLIIIPILILLFKSLRYLFLLEIICYFVLDFLFSFKGSNDIKTYLVMLLLFPCFHISYGIGSLNGIITVALDKSFDNKYVPEKI